MPWLPFYATKDDLEQVYTLLGDDIVGLYGDGPGRWRARTDRKPPVDRRTLLWHVTGGALPLYHPRERPLPDIPDPFAGWAERQAGANPHQPYFGAGHPAIFALNLRTTQREPGSVCGLSSFGWIGNRYGRIGSPAPKATKNRWAKLQRDIRQVAVKVPRGEITSDEPPEIWAFPSAYAKLGKGDIWPF